MEAVNRIQVDGKNFFGDDPKMATRNLPACDRQGAGEPTIRRAACKAMTNVNNVGKVIIYPEERC